MGINKVRFQKGLSMAAFLERYGTEEKCHAATVALRWPSGFVCPECGESRHCTFEPKGPTYWQCSECREQTTVMCGTIFEATKLPLTTWFLAMHLMTQGQEQGLGPGTEAPSGGALPHGLAAQAQADASHERAGSAAPA